MTFLKKIVTVVSASGSSTSIGWTTFNAQPYIPVGSSIVGLNCYASVAAITTQCAIYVRANSLGPEYRAATTSAVAVANGSDADTNFILVPLDATRQSFDYKVAVTGTASYTIELICVM